MGGGADSPKASPKAASPRGDGKVAGFGELAQEEEAQAQDRLAVATKMGAEREALSAARDLSKAKAKLAALQQQMEAKEKAMMLQKDKMSKQELALFKLGKEHEREQSEHRKCSKLCNNRGDELAQLKKKYSADMSTEQDRTKDALQKCDDLENAMAAVEKQLGAATGSLRSAHNAMERLNKSEENANQKMLLMRDTVVKQEADIRDLTSRLRIETNEHMKSEERGGKYQAEIKLQKQRLEAEQIRAGQCMSSLATVKSELAVALEANAAQGMTPAIVLENDQLKLDREGFMTQIRGLTDTISRLEMTSNNALRSLEKEKSEHVRFQMLYKEKTEELNKHKKMMQSMKEANRESTAQLDGKVMEMNAEVKEMTRVQAGTEGDLRVKSTQATNLQAECAQLQKRIVSLKDTQTQNLTRINTLEDDLNRENRLRIRMETELSLMTEKQKRTKDQAASDTRSFTLQKEEMTRELTESQSECTRLLAQLDKEKKAAAQASQLKNKAGDDQSKAVQKAQEHRERFEKAQIALAEAQQSLHEEQTLRVGAEKSNKKNSVLNEQLTRKLQASEKDLSRTKIALTKSETALKTANAELAVFRAAKEEEMQKRPEKANSPRDYSDMRIPMPPSQPRVMMNDSGPIQTPNLDAQRLPSGRLRRARPGRPRIAFDGTDSPSDERGYREGYEPLNQFHKEIERLSEPVEVPGFGSRGTGSSARAAARSAVSAR